VKISGGNCPIAPLWLVAWSLFNVVFAYGDHGIRSILLLWVFSRDEKIYGFQIQFQSKIAHILKSNGNPKQNFF